MQTVLAEGLAASGEIAHGIEIVDNVAVSYPFQNLIKDHSHRIHLIVFDLIAFGFGIDLISEGRTASHRTALQRRLPHPLHHLACKVSGVVFAHALQHRFENDALGRIIQIFQHADQRHTASLQLTLVVCGIVTVSAEAIQLMHDHNIEFAVF